MKWKKVAKEFIPEKTFLIIKDDLQSLEGENKQVFKTKENSIRRVKAKSALDTGTWPPKLKNHQNHSQNNQNEDRRSWISGERPKTANLERPSVLDPRLLKKLDMSLVSKELLCDSMTRIQQSVKTRGGGGAGTRSTTSGSSRRRQSVPVGEKSRSFVSGGSRGRNANSYYDVEQEESTISLPIAITYLAKKRSCFECQTVNETSKMNQDISLDSSITKKQSSTRRPKNNSSSCESRDKLSKRRINEGKKLDDNNNKNNCSSNDGNSSSTRVSSLSSLKKTKASKFGASTEIEVFTGATTKDAPEPCKTCGRPDQPERFHSHPKSSIVMTKKDKDFVGNESKKIAVPKTIQKPVALNFRSEKSKMKKAREEKQTVATPKGQTSKDHSPRDNDEGKKRRDVVQSAPRKGPRTVTCYICAREFGTASFPIHEPKCIQKWERENNSLPAAQRRPMPQRPLVTVDHRDWNSAAWEQSQAQLVPCWKCGRTFLPDRLVIHERSCKSSRTIRSSGNSPIIEKPVKYDETRIATAGTTILCQICGRNFGTRSIKIHEAQCMKKCQIENNSSPLYQRKKIPMKNDKSSDLNGGERQSQTSPMRLAPPQKPTTTCYICGRDFGSASIDIHEPQCLRKWQNENSKLPAHQQRDEPQKPETIFISETPTGSPMVDWAATAEARWKTHLGQLVPCAHCKRTFNPERVAVHERSCKGIR